MHCRDAVIKLAKTVRAFIVKLVYYPYSNSKIIETRDASIEHGCHYRYMLDTELL